MSNELSRQTIKLLKAWQESVRSVYPEDDEGFEELADIYAAYDAGLRDGKIELATDLIEELDLINYN